MILPECQSLQWSSLKIQLKNKIETKNQEAKNLLVIESARLQKDFNKRLKVIQEIFVNETDSLRTQFIIQRKEGK